MSIIPFRNRMKGKVDVWWEKQYSVCNVLNIPYEQRLRSSIAIPFRNRMKGKVDIIAPKRQVAIIPPIEDTFISETNSYMIFGYGKNLLVGYNENKQQYEGLLKFNLQEHFPSFNKDSIIVTDAQIKLTIDDYKSSIENDKIIFYECFDDWKETSTTWENKPSESNVIISSYDIQPSDIIKNGYTNVYIDLNQELTTEISNNDVSLWDGVTSDRWQITKDNKILMTKNYSSADIMYNTRDILWQDYSLSTNVITYNDDDIIGLVFRYQDESNYYYIGFNGGTETWYKDFWDNTENKSSFRLYKVQDGIRTLLAQSNETPYRQNNKEYKMAVNIKGNDILASIDDKYFIEYKLDSNMIENGTYGFLTYSQEAVFTQATVKHIPRETLISRWIDNPRKNNGIIIKNNNQNNIISFLSKENGNPKLSPQLLVTYIDLNAPFVTKNNYLHAFVYVWENKTSHITSELEVVTRQSTNSIPSEIFVLNQPGDLPCILDISKDRMLSELDLVGSHVGSEINVYINDTTRIKNSLYVKSINTEGTVKISHSSKLFNTIKTQYGKYLKGFLGINPNRLVNEIDIHSWNNILNFLSVHEYWRIQNKLSITYGNSIANEVFIPPMSHLKNKIEILAQGGLTSDIFYGRFADLVGYLSIAPQSNIVGNLLFIYESLIKNTANILAVKQIINDLRYSGMKNLTNYLSSSNINYMQNVLVIANKYINANLTIQELKYITNSIGVQGRNIHSEIHSSTQKSIESIIKILLKNEVINTIKILNEHIENSVIVYIRETNYCRGKIHALAVNNILANLQHQYGNKINARIDIYVDMISVLHSYVDVVNDDEKYNQRKGYGYIM